MEETKYFLSLQIQSSKYSPSMFKRQLNNFEVQSYLTNQLLSNYTYFIEIYE